MYNCASFKAATTAALLAPALASPIFGPQWAVTNYKSGCSPGGCTYTFSVAADQPAFSGQCTGTSVQDGFAACQLAAGSGDPKTNALEAKLADFGGNGGNQTLVVSFATTYRQDASTVRRDNYTLHIHDKLLGFNHPQGWFQAPDEVTSVA